MRPIRVRDYKLSGIVRRVQELESRGFECIAPIQKNFRSSKDFKSKASSNVEGGYRFDGMLVDTFYTCVMKKAE